MKFKERLRLERMLSEHYRKERENDPLCADALRQTAAMASLAASRIRDRGNPRLTAIVAIGAIPKILWTLPAAIVLLAFSIALSGPSAKEAETALIVSGPLLAAASLMGFVRAKSFRMQELEATCPFNAVAAACARIVALGGASLLALAALCAACASVIPAGEAVSYALAPCLASAAGGLLIARKVASGDAAAGTASWSASVCLLCTLLRTAVPEAYGDAALWAWGAIAAASAMWLAREIAAWLWSSAQGGCTTAGKPRPVPF